MQFLTDFADQAVLLPLAAMVALVLAAAGWWRGLAAWLAAVVGVLGTMAVLKYAFFACAGLLGGTGVHSPSGHTAAATIVMGGALVLFLRGRVAPVVLGAIPPGFAVVFGLSRLAVGAHTAVEAVAGGAVGLAGAAALAALAGPRPALPARPAALGALLVLAGLHGARLNAETALHSSRLLTWLPLPAACRA